MSDASTNALQIVEDATCLGCACLCDDIGLCVEGGRIVEARRACGLGLAWYERARTDLAIGPTIAGEPATLDRTLDRAADVLAGARAPVVLGLGATVEAQRAAVAIADRLGASIGPLSGRPAGLSAFQRLGAVSATLGEIRDRADLILFDQTGLPGALPRFLERFVDARGRFVPQGRAGRTVIVLRTPAGGEIDDDEWTSRPDLLIDIGDYWTTTYATLRALVNGTTLDPAEFEARTGDRLEPLIDLAARLGRAKYGVLVHGRLNPSETDREALLALVRDLNRFTRWVALDVTNSGADEAGAEAVLAWQAGTSRDVDFALGHPRHLPREDVLGRMIAGEADAVLLIGDLDHLSWPSIGAALLGAIPKVVVGPVGPEEWSDDLMWKPYRDRRGRLLQADAFLPTARAGIDEGGTVARVDGVMLPLRPPFPGRRATQAEILHAIDARLVATQNRREADR